MMTEDKNVNYEIDSDILEHLKETNRAEIFKEIIKPDLRKEVRLQIVDEDGNVLDDMTLFTKELKVSNLNDFQIMYVTELTDLAYTLFRHGMVETAKELIAYRDTLLSVAPSRHATLLKLMNTEYSVQKIEQEERKYKRWFRSGGESYYE